jgi:general secretion pathway protein D
MIMDFSLARLNLPMFYRCLVFAVALLACTYSFAEDVTLNFSDADLSAVVNSVSQITGKNFIIDPRVKGKVTVISSKPLNEDEVYNVFLSILQVHGFATVPTKNAIKIIPDAAAKQDSAPFVNSSYPDNDQLVTQVITIENVNATQLVPILRPLVAQQGHLAAYAETNVLIVSDRASNIKRVMQIIKQVDKKTDEELEFVKLEHAFATEVVRLLSGLSSGDAVQNKGAAPSIKFSADERTNSILLSGEKNLRLKYRSIITQLDQPVESTGNIHVVYLRYANAANIAKIMGSVGKDVLNAQKKNADVSKSSGDTALNIQADDVSNALVITAPMSIFRSLRSVIQQLDIPRAQVHIEAIIAEVSMNASNELGVQWLIDDTSSNGPAIATNFAGSGSNITSLAAGISSGTGASIGEGLSLALGRIGESSLDFVTLIRALSGDSDNNLLSTPSIVTLDNQQAEIIVGENVPFITGEYTTSTSGTSSSNPFRTVERKDVGISLKVKPQINEGNTITMEIEQEVSNLNGSSTGVDVITSKRSLKTMVQLEDGELLVLGGLIDDILVEKQQKVPGLGDIPILGALFRSSTMEKSKRNLMIFLRANIIKDPVKARILSRKKYNSLRDYQLKRAEENDNNPPVLDNLNLILDLDQVGDL